jgi:hypothetical protein
MTGRIFVNYRRDDSAAHALSIAQYLEREFGSDNVFLDIDRMRAGQKFPKVLEERLTQSKVMLVVIGPTWLTAKNDAGARRIDDPEDWVHLEIARALARDLPLIPVLVGGASLPKRAELPDDLKPIVDHQIATLTTNGFRNDMAGLARDVRELLGGTRRRWPLAAVAGCRLGQAQRDPTSHGGHKVVGSRPAEVAGLDPTYVENALARPEPVRLKGDDAPACNPTTSVPHGDMLGYSASRLTQPTFSASVALNQKGRLAGAGLSSCRGLEEDRTLRGRSGSRRYLEGAKV